MLMYGARWSSMSSTVKPFLSFASMGFGIFTRRISCDTGARFLRSTLLGGEPSDSCAASLARGDGQSNSAARTRQALLHGLRSIDHWLRRFIDFYRSTAPVVLATAFGKVVTIVRVLSLKYKRATRCRSARVTASYLRQTEFTRFGSL